jgi:hypothetical protein
VTQSTKVRLRENPRRLDFQRQNDRNPVWAIGSASTVPEASRNSPTEQQSVESAENKSLRRFAPQHIYLVPKNQYFRLKPDS